MASGSKTHGAQSFAKARWDGDLTLTTVVRYEATRGSFRIDLGLGVVP